jgi:hypothetical protein
LLGAGEGRSGSKGRNREYTSDDAGNITAIADAIDATYNRTFGYDDLSRLTAASTGTSRWLRSQSSGCDVLRQQHAGDDEVLQR